MEVPKTELFAVLQEFNPWWTGQPVSDLPDWERSYQDSPVDLGKFKGLRLFLENQKVEHGYIISRRWEDFGVLNVPSAKQGRERELLNSKILTIPAPLACYWLSS